MSISIDSSISPKKATDTKKTSTTSEDQEIDSQETVELKVDKFEYSQPLRNLIIAECDYQRVRTCAQTLIQGKQSEEEYKVNFKADFYNKLKINLERGFTTDDKADILKILDSTYNSYKTGALSAALIESNAEGFRKYGSEDRSALYYSADYYYKAEDIKDALKDCYVEINKEFGLNQTDVPKTTQHETFNDIWALNMGGRGVFNAKKAGAPPEGFELYFKSDKYKTGEFKNSHQTYRLIAGNNSAEESGVLYIDVPNGWSLFNKNSKLTGVNLDSLLSRSNTQAGTISYNITDLIDGYPGKDITARLKAFVVANCINEQAGTLKASCGDWSMETDIPFSTRTKTFAYKGSEITSLYSGDKSNSAAVSYLDHFTFEKYPLFERMKKLGLYV